MERTEAGMKPECRRLAEGVRAVSTKKDRPTVLAAAVNFYVSAKKKQW